MDAVTDVAAQWQHSHAWFWINYWWRFAKAQVLDKLKGWNNLSNHSETRSRIQIDKQVWEYAKHVQFKGQNGIHNLMVFSKGNEKGNYHEI